MKRCVHCGRVYRRACGRGLCYSCYYRRPGVKELYKGYRKVDRERMVALHNQGHSAWEIARRLGNSRNTIAKYLKAMGLAPNGKHSLLHLESRRKSLLRTCRANGVKTFGQLKRQHLRARASLMGWPQVHTPCQVLVVECLAQGEKTHGELSEALGKGGRTVMTHLINLRRLGVVVVLSGKGRRPSPYVRVYALKEGVQKR